MASGVAPSELIAQEPMLYTAVGDVDPGILTYEGIMQRLQELWDASQLTAAFTGEDIE